MYKIPSTATQRTTHNHADIKLTDTISAEILSPRHTYASIPLQSSFPRTNKQTTAILSHNRAVKLFISLRPLFYLNPLHPFPSSFVLVPCQQKRKKTRSRVQGSSSCKCRRWECSTRGPPVNPSASECGGVW